MVSNSIKWWAVGVGAGCLVAWAIASTYLEPINVFTLKPESAAAEVQAAWVQAIGSVIAIAVAIVAGEIQHKRAIRLVKDQQQREDNERQRRLQNTAVWMASSLWDATVRAGQRKKLIAGLGFNQLNAPIPLEEARQLQSLVAAFSGDWGVLNSLPMQSINEFDSEITEAIVAAIRSIQVYRSGLEGAVNFAISGKITGAQLEKAFQTAIERAETIESRCKHAFELMSSAFGLATVEPIPPATGEKQT